MKVKKSRRKRSLKNKAEYLAMRELKIKAKNQPKPDLSPGVTIYPANDYFPFVDFPIYTTLLMKMMAYSRKQGKMD